MQITNVKKDKTSFACTVTMTGEEIGALVDARLEEIGKTVKLPGFRPGKAPMNLLKSKYGKSVMGEVLEDAVHKSTTQAVNENSLRPAMRPKIEVKTFDEAKGLEYSMEMELLPEIKVAAIDDIKLEKLTAKPDPKKVRETIEKIAASQKTSEKIEEARAAKAGDIVLIDFDGTVNGERQPGMKGEGHELELGSKSFIEGFEDQLIGAKAGESKTVKVKFPDDYGHEALRGVNAEFAVTVHELRKPVPPEINDEFAKKIGFESLAKLEEIVEKQMQGEYDQVTRMNLKRALLDVLDERHDFDLPKSMVEAEFSGIWHQMTGNNDHDHSKHEHKFETEEENEEYRGIAERRVKLGLVLAEIGRANKIEVTNQELQQAVIAEARRYPGQEKEVFEFFSKNAQALESLKAPIYEDKIVDFIMEKIKIDTKEVSIEELTKVSEEEPPKKKAKSASKGK